MKTRYAKLLKPGDRFHDYGAIRTVTRVEESKLTPHMVEVHYEIPGYTDQVIVAYGDWRVRLSE